jgi:hypothetical protein
MTARAASLLALFALTLPASATEPPAVRLVSPKPGATVVEVTGLDAAALKALADAKLTAEEWPKVARLVVDSGTPEEVAKKPPVAGEWSVAGGALKFEPLFPLAPGGKYRVFLDPGAIPGANFKGEKRSLSLTVPRPPPGPRVRITHVYPSANRLPENTLRFYVHFSGPVQRGDVYKRFKLIRDDGKQVVRPFVELDEELWSSDGLRLTLLFDPGRVKQGLVPREELGPILEEGRRYTFTIDGDWPDGEGRPLVSGFKKTFAATAPDDDPVWPDQWKLVVPRAGSDAPLLVRLAKPLDRALLGRMLWVVDAKGSRVEGSVTVGGGERVVTFAPKRPWARGDYKLVIDDELEDVCGNRVGQPFEVDVFHPIPERPKVKLTERTFAVK